MQFTVCGKNNITLAALSLDPSGFIALCALMQTTRRTTGPFSARLATNMATDRIYAAFRGRSTWEAETWFQRLLLQGCTCPHRASNLIDL